MSNSRAILAYLLSPSLLKLLLFVPIFLLIPNIGVAADDGVSLDKELAACRTSRIIKLQATHKLPLQEWYNINY